MIKNSFFKATLIFGLFCTAAAGQNVTIPDINFKAALVANPSINTNADGEIQVSEASAFLGTITVSGLGITDLTGIEAFTSVSQLNCANNSLTSINISANTGLTLLDCRNNQLTSLDVSTNIFLYEFRCSVNQITSLDVSTNINLFLFACGDNKLATLDVSANTLMQGFFCHNNLLTSIDVSANPALTQFWCYGNQLTNLDVSAQPNLLILDCTNNKLTSLNLATNTSLGALECTNNLLTSLNLTTNTILTQLFCGQNKLTSIDVSSNPSLSLFDCSSNQITNLDVTNNPSLQSLKVDSNKISSINLSANSALNELWCFANLLSVLDVSTNVALSSLDCKGNQISNLNVSANSNLTYFNCSDNQLTTLNIQNGNNTNFVEMSANDNPSLTCIQVDSVAYAQANFAAFIDNGASFSTDCSNFLYVPDSVFKAYLLAEPSINTNLDYEIQLTEAALFTGTINVNGLGVADLTGIEAFTSVSQLNCSNNTLTSINVSANTGLTLLDCRNNQLTSLDVSTNTVLYEFRCSVNQITALDVSNNTNLFLFACGDNKLTTLDVSANTLMQGFFCHNNLLTSIDVSANPALVQFWCFGNQISTIDVTANPNLYIFDCRNNQLASLTLATNNALAALACTNNLLTSLVLPSSAALSEIYCDQNQLTSLDVSANPALINLNCASNQITALNVASNPALITLTCNTNAISSLDISSNSSITSLSCENNQLTQLNAKNGNNLNFFGFSAIGNPSLYCIQVDDTAYSNANWSSGKNSSTAFSEDCACTFPIPDSNFKNALVANFAINTNQDAEIQCYEADIYNGAVVIENLGIATLTGIEKFKRITLLACKDNQLTTLDLSANPKLTALFCNNNQLTSLNITGNPLITLLGCGVNQLTSLDLTNNTNLQNVNLEYNQLTTLDVSNNTKLVIFYVNNNKLTTLDLSNKIFLGRADLYNNLMTSVNLTNCTALTTVGVNNNQLTSLDISTLSSLLSLYADFNNLTSLDLSNNSALQNLSCSSNQLSYLNTTANNDLFDLRCQNNQLTILNLSPNPLLSYLDCQNNSLSYLNIQNGNNINITGLNAKNNPALTCIQVDNAAYMNANWSAGKDAGALFTTNCGCVYKYWYLDNDNDGYGIQALDSISCTQPLGYSLNYPDCNDNDSLAHEAPGNSVSITSSVASFCNGTSNAFISAINSVQPLTYHWTVNGSGLTTTAVNNETSIENLGLTFDNFITGFDVSVYVFNSCGTSPVSSVYNFPVYTIPDSAGPITGVTSVSACANQLGITYSIAPIPSAAHYYWTLPPLATIVGNPDTNFITVNYSPYSTSGNVTVSGRNGAGCDGIPSALAISYAPIPSSEICSATIDSATQHSLITWQKPTESYVDAYVIYREINGQYVAIATIPDSAFSSYIDLTSRPDSIPEKYKIATLDSCGNQTSISTPFKHQTIRLLGAVLLGGGAKLYWNEYQGVTDPTSYYTLLRDTIGNGAFNDTLLTNIPPSGTGSISKVDITAANYPICRYVVDFSYASNCAPSQRMQTNRSTSRSNIKNKVAFLDSTTLGINTKIVDGFEIKIYPNPVKDILSIQLPNADPIYDLGVFDLLGNRVIEATSFTTKNATMLEVATQNLLKGMYIVKLKNSKGTRIAKFVKE